jgi:cytochrome c oxidase cbb3-type subunit 3
MSSRKERILEHAYDDIHEYDNPTPGWWHLFFLGSIAFSALYAAFFHGSRLSWTPQEVLDSDRQAYYGVLFKELGTLQPDEPTMIRLMQDEKWMAFGSTIFSANCAQCHGADGSGINGANLTDDRWINVKKLTDVFTVISEGVGTKGMPSWKNRLGDNERILVASYVANLRKTPVKGRNPEGEVIPPWNAPSAAAEAPGTALTSR